jgi:hypothetical protein
MTNSKSIDHQQICSQTLEKFEQSLCPRSPTSCNSAQVSNFKIYCADMITKHQWSSCFGSQQEDRQYFKSGFKQIKPHGAPKILSTFSYVCMNIGDP